MLAVVVAEGEGEYQFERRRYGSNPAHLRLLSEWLIEQQVEEVVMESTAQYWKPVWEGLERYWKPSCQKREGAGPMSGALHLAQAQSNRGPQGGKKDFPDAERLVKRLVAQELILSFVPDAEQRLWRTVMRRKYQLTRDRVQLQNRLESLLEETHIKLSSLVSDLLGASARRMLKALADGETNPTALAALADKKLRATQAQLCDALAACTELNPVYRRLLKMVLEELQFLEQQIVKLEQEMASLLSQHQGAVQRLAEVPGLGVDSAQQIIAEVGANLFSTTPRGGAYGIGAVFKITLKGSLTVLYSFTDGNDGYLPNSGLTLGTDGNFYGSSDKIIFKVTPGGVLTIMHTFTGGEEPNASPIQGTDGNFYGTTQFGGEYSDGTVYKLTPSGQLTTLHSFDGNDGLTPYAPLVQGTDGNLYGTATFGGPGGSGVVFKITTAGKFTLLYAFDGTHGSLLYAPLIQGNDRNFYGTALEGGSGGCSPPGCGTVFKITPNGRITVLYSFGSAKEGIYPYAGLVQGNDGNFYGSTSQSGSFENCSVGCGTIFRITPKGNYSVLYTFDNTTGASPQVTLFQHTNGILYGDTFQGGTGKMCVSGNCGVFYGLNVGLGPFVTLVSTTGKVGKTIEILGQGFKGTTGISFNGTPATFKVVSSTYLTVKVPGGATTGFVTVTTPKRKLKSNKKFRVN